MELEAAVRDYLDREMVLQGRADNTRRCYGTDLGQFIDYCREHVGAKPGVECVGREHVEGFLHRQLLAGVGRATVRRRGFVLRGFFRWARETGLCGENPAERVPVPRSRRPLPYCPGGELVESMLHACSDPTTRALIATLFYTGMRVGELCSLALDDVRLEEGRVLVRRGKGGKSRFIPLHSKLVPVLRHYGEQVRPDVDSDRFFSTSSGRMSTRWASLLIERERHRQGITDPLTPHSLRHAFATELYKKGVDLRKLQALLGHSSLQTLEVYVHLSGRDLQEAVDRL